MLRLLAPPLLLAIVLAAPPASGRAGTLDGHLRWRHATLESFPLDAAGTGHGQRQRSEARLHVGGSYVFSPELTLGATVQLLEGQQIGDESAVDGGYLGPGWRHRPLRDQVALRRLVLQVPIGLGVARVGRDTVRWGLGLLLNDGEAPTGPFGDPTAGDVSNGLWLDVKPLLPFLRGRVAHAVRLDVGVELVERDELTRRREGDVSVRFSGGLRWEEPLLKGGVLVLLRDLRREGGSRVRQGVLDITASWERPVSERRRLRVGGELAIVGGEARTKALDGGPSARDNLRQVGAVARVEWLPRGEGTSAVLEVGVATGDEDPADAEDTMFRFDPAWRTGMVLFEEVLARTSARARERISATPAAPARPERPTLLPTGGAVAGAAYLAPRLHADTGLAGLGLDAGAVVAFAPDPFVDPASAAAGDARSPYGGAPRSGLLGWELDVGALMTVALPDVATLDLGSQVGVFVPGPALAGRDGGPAVGSVVKWRLLADIRW